MKITVKKEEKEILNDFLVEAFENLDGIEAKILKMEENFDLEHINDVFRPLHTLKGLSGFMEGMQYFTKVCQDAEGILDGLRKDKIEKNSDIIDVLLNTVDYLKKILDMLNGKKDEDGDIEIDLADDFIVNYKEIDTPKKNDNSDSFYTYMRKILGVLQKLLNRIEYSKLTKYIFIRTEKVLNIFKNIIEKSGNSECVNCYEELQKSLNSKDEISIIKTLKDFIKRCSQNIEKSITAGKLVCRNIQEHYKRDKESETSYLKVKSEKIDNIIGLIGELSTLKNSFNAVYKELNDKYNLADVANKIKNLSVFIQRTTEELQNAVLEIRMVPVETIFAKYQRVVRDLSKKLNKEVELIIDAKDSIIDKNLAEKLNEPFLHLIRNAVDHGIEFPEERKIKGKKERGTIKITAENKGRYILIEFYDDGKGLNKDKITNKALEKGLISEERLKGLRDKDIYNLIFLPGFSTAKNVTEISGRGVGMEIVKNVVDDVKGSIEVITEEDKFTKFVLKLPLMLSLNHGILVCANDNKFLIPMDYIEEIVRININDIVFYNKKAFGEVRGKVMSFIPLSLIMDKFSKNIEEELMENKNYNGELTALVINCEGRYYSLVIKEILGQQEFVLKNLPGNIKENGFLLGATIDVDGNIIPVINPYDVIKVYDS